MTDRRRAASLALPFVPEQYDRNFMLEVLRHIQEQEERTYRNDADVEISGDADSGGRAPRLILRSPDGERWDITVDNAGAISATKI